MLGMRYRTCSTQPARQSRCQVEINVGQPNYIKPISLGLWLLKKDRVFRNPSCVMGQSTMSYSAPLIILRQQQKPVLLCVYVLFS